MLTGVNFATVAATYWYAFQQGPGFMLHNIAKIAESVPAKYEVEKLMMKVSPCVRNSIL